MLREIKPVRQIPGEPRRRIFVDDFFILTVWHLPQGSLIGFQLCHERGPNEKALSWSIFDEFSHDRAEDGEGIPGHYKMTPILVGDGLFDKDNILALFKKESTEIDPTIVSFVCEKIMKYPAARSEGYQHP